MCSIASNNCDSLAATNGHARFQRKLCFHPIKGWTMLLAVAPSAMVLRSLGTLTFSRLRRLTNTGRTHARPERRRHFFSASLRIAPLAIAAIRTLSVGRANGILARRLCLLLFVLATTSALVALAIAATASRRGAIRRPFIAFGSFLGPIPACLAACLGLLRCRLLFTSLATLLLGLFTRHL